MAGAISGLALRIAEVRAVRALNNGLMQVIPFILAGAICVALLNFPLPAYQDFVRNLFDGRVAGVFEAIQYATLDIIALVILFAVSYSYVSDEPLVKKGDVHPLIPVITTFCCYMALFVELRVADAVAIAGAGRGGTLISLLLALVVPWLFFAFLKLRMKIRPFRYSALDSNLLMRLTFRVVFPVAATILTVVLVNIVVLHSPLFEIFTNRFNTFAAEYLGKENFGSVVLTVLAMQLMWFIGIHGGGVIFDDLMHNATVADTSSMFATQDFYFVFVNLGGAGAALGLLVAMAVFKPGYRDKRLVRVSAIPVAFNINETLTFGIPIIFNPFYAIPFIFGQVLIAAVAYGAFTFGLVPLMTVHVEWTTPIILSGFLSTGSLAGVILQLVCLACSVAVYAPFVLGYRRSLVRHRAERVANMQKALVEAADNEALTVITRNDAVGTSAREVSAYIHGCFEQEQLPFYLVYQPKTDKQGRALGAEALLRWQHPDYGVISPVVLVELCDENDLSTELGRWITEAAMEEYARWKKLGIDDLLLSINLNPQHLKRDGEFVEFMAEKLAQHDIEPGEIELEITEHMAMHSSEANRELLKKVRELGVELSIDDMGIGYSSLTYISDFGAKRIKIDASLVSEIESDYQQREIVRSIVDLAKQLDLNVVVEGVEEKSQMEALVELGVGCFQGYYFSKPLLPDDFVAYVWRHR